MSDDPPLFDHRFRAELRRLLAWRRDVRRFRSDPIAPQTLARLIEIACSAPSVGLSQPWRFVIVDDIGRRRSIIDEFRHCNAAALNRYSGERASRYARLKLAGLEEAPVHLAVFAERETEQGHGLGRLTMPETADYSVIAAIVTLWLAARAEGIGLGWVSILRPGRIPDILSVSPRWRFIAYLCLGYPQHQSVQPELERDGWDARKPAAAFIVRR
jgi:5,6-dimethylbenzimidazole synthase